MGGFIYCKKQGHLEHTLVRDHGFQPISYETYDKFRMLFLGTINKKEESFCMRVKNGVKVGAMMTPDLALLTDKNADTTVLVSARQVVRSAGDIKAVLAFRHSGDKAIRVDGMCSNQVVKSNEGVVLVKHLKNVCERQGIMVIDKKHYTTKSNKSNKRKKKRGDKTKTKRL